MPADSESPTTRSSLCFNAHHEPIDFTLPADEFGQAWLPVVNTAELATSDDEPEPVAASATARVESRAMVVLQAAPQSKRRRRRPRRRL